jgi:vanillate O-demethylase ferredoxin subunit
LPAFSAGSHIDVHIAPGLVRQYSLCNDPAEVGRYQIAVKREPASRGGSQAMHEQVREGDLLAISAPRNNFALSPAAKHHLLIAGGIGITPLLSMTRQLLPSGAEFSLVYFSRSVAHTAFHELLSAPEFRGRISFHYALEPEQVRAYLRKLLWSRPPDGHLYLCGPRPFMDLVETTAAPTWPPDAVHLEYFSADPASLAGPKGGFVVRLARHGGEFEIAEGRTNNRGARGARHYRRYFVRTRRLRDLSHRSAGGRTRPSRCFLDRRGKDCERPDDGLRISGEEPAPGPGSVIHRTSMRARSLRPEGGARFGGKE